jgi:4-amino-4-deoxy-L-arabinose transferase-like glycosyltransferase
LIVDFASASRSQGDGPRFWLGVATCFALALAIAAYASMRGGQIDYDGAVYLERGLYHAEQVAAKGDLYALRLPWSLRFESPKPPLYHGLLAAAALVVGRERVETVLFLGAFLPALALLLGVYALARRGALRSPLLAVVILVAMPVVLRVGSRLLAETTLAACVAVCACFALNAMRAGGKAEDAAGLGASAGLAALAKLTGIVFGGVVLLVAAATVWRRAGAVRSARCASIAVAVALVVAGPWYLRNGDAALEFGRVSADSWAHADPGSPWTRPGRLVLESIGAPLASIACAFVVLAWRTRRTRDASRLDLARLAATVAGISAAMVLTPRNFDPRFWAPALGLVAVWMAGELSDWASTATRKRAVGIALAVSIGFAVASAANDRASSTSWRLGTLVDLRADQLAGGARLCNLGESYSWNRFQMRLMTQVATLRPRPEVFDLLHDGSLDLERELARCELLFLLDPAEISGERTQIRENDGLMRLRPQVVELAERRMARDRDAEAVLGSSPRVRVWRRATATAGANGS